MMKRHYKAWLFATLGLLFISARSTQAQSITVANSDSIPIHYTIQSDSTLMVTAGNYERRVVVPATVSYEGREYTVTTVGLSAFAGRDNLSYVQLPATISTIGASVFRGSGIDTVVLLSTTPPALEANTEEFFNTIFSGITNPNYIVWVPAGTLQTYRSTLWKLQMRLSTPEAVPITLPTSMFATLQVEGILIFKYARFATDQGLNASLTHYTLYGEIGNMLEIDGTLRSANNLLAGWSGTVGNHHEVQGADTLSPMVLPMGVAQLEVGNISTPVMVGG